MMKAQRCKNAPFWHHLKGLPNVRAIVQAMRVMQKGKIKKKKSEILHNLIFDYLESHQFDLSYFTNVYGIA